MYPNPPPPINYDYIAGEWPADVPKEQRDRSWTVRTYAWPFNELEGTQHFISMPQSLQSAFETLGNYFRQMRTAKNQMKATAPATSPLFPGRRYATYPDTE